MTIVMTAADGSAPGCEPCLYRRGVCLVLCKTLASLVNTREHDAQAVSCAILMRCVTFRNGTGSDDFPLLIATHD